MIYRTNICPRDGRHTHVRAFCSECLEPRHCGGGASERMLKCSHCGVRTLHIVSGMENRNDPYDYGTPAQAQVSHRATSESQIDPEAVLKAIGLRPVYVQGLGRTAWLIDDASIVLIDADLSPDRMAEVVTQVLEQTRGTES